MITEKDLLEAIAECEGERNPNANTCIKLAAFYTIKNQLFPEQLEQARPIYQESFEGPEKAEFLAYDEASEFAQLVNGRNIDEVMAVMDELMQSLQVIEPRLYNAVLRKFY